MAAIHAPTRRRALCAPCAAFDRSAPTAFGHGDRRKLILIRNSANECGDNAVVRATAPRAARCSHRRRRAGARTGRGHARHGEFMSLQQVRPALPGEDKRWKLVNGTMRRNGYAGHALIETLHTVQERLRLPRRGLAALRRARRCDLPLSQGLRRGDLLPLLHAQAARAAHACVVCTGTACYIKGADRDRDGRRAGASASGRARPPPDGQPVAADGALRRRLRPGAGGGARRRRAGQAERRRAAWRRIEELDA
ncbi:MAG: hypothetical protein MZV65_18535 [Chromatiales bacterium]|nr:hypothetical protein [Chromatiales bacterium]